MSDARPTMRNLLMVSTCHITEKTCDLLCDIDNTIVMSGPFDVVGAFVWVYPEQNGGDQPIPDDLWKVMQFAGEHDADYILFDSDANVYESLPQYDWSQETANG